MITAEAIITNARIKVQDTSQLTRQLTETIPLASNRPSMLPVKLDDDGDYELVDHTWRNLRIRVNNDHDLMVELYYSRRTSSHGYELIYRVPESDDYIIVQALWNEDNIVTYTVMQLLINCPTVHPDGDNICIPAGNICAGMILTIAL